VTGFWRRHLSVLERRCSFLAARVEAGKANSYEKAERAALEAALSELRTKFNTEQG
jgi:hypothetical protein